MSDDKKDINLNLSKESQCPYDGHVCNKRADDAQRYAAFLSQLAEEAKLGRVSSEIFTSGDVDNVICNTCEIYQKYVAKCR